MPAGLMLKKPPSSSWPSEVLWCYHVAMSWTKMHAVLLILQCLSSLSLSWIQKDPFQTENPSASLFSILPQEIMTLKALSLSRLHMVGICLRPPKVVVRKYTFDSQISRICMKIPFLEIDFVTAGQVLFLSTQLPNFTLDNMWNLSSLALQRLKFEDGHSKVFTMFSDLQVLSASMVALSIFISWLFWFGSFEQMPFRGQKKAAHRLKDRLKSCANPECGCGKAFLFWVNLGLLFRWFFIFTLSFLG